MSGITSEMLCPACSGPLHPRVLECRKCDIRVEGDFEGSEFDSLTGDELHLLRIFIRCEGRIRDMESALGISYPTVKARLADLRRALGLEDDPAPADDGDDPEPATHAGDRDERSGAADVDALLDGIEEGKLDPDEAIRKLRE